MMYEMGEAMSEASPFVLPLDDIPIFKTMNTWGGSSSQQKNSWEPRRGYADPFYILILVFSDLSQDHK